MIHAIPIDMLIVSIKVIIIIIVIITYFHQSIFVAKFMIMLLRMMIRHSIEAIAVIHRLYCEFSSNFTNNVNVAI